jgi:hypothetical protein
MRTCVPGSAKSRSARFEPMKPAPPVIRTVRAALPLFDLFPLLASEVIVLTLISRLITL